MKMWSAIIISMFMMAPVVQANAQNYPCSKSMGGVSHCQNGKFVCNMLSVIDIGFYEVLYLKLAEVVSFRCSGEVQPQV